MSHWIDCLGDSCYVLIPLTNSTVIFLVTSSIIPQERIDNCDVFIMYSLNLQLYLKNNIFVCIK